MQVLLIETEMTLQRSLELALAMRGHATVVAPTVAAALDAFGHGQFALVVIGSLLAGPDAALDLCRDLRRQPNAADATILIIAWPNDHARIVAALDAGADGYVSHPLAATQLRAHLERVERAAERVITGQSMSPTPLSTQRRDVDDARNALLINNAVDALLIIDAGGVISWVAPPVAAVLGRRPGGLVGTSLYGICHPEDAEMLTGLLARVLSEAELTPADLRLRHQDGSWREFDVRAIDLRQEPSVDGIVLAARDVTHRRRREERSIRQSLYDPLTGLPNRAVFMAYLEHALARSDRRAEPVVVMFMDLDDFAIVKQRLGRVAGDQLLAGVAQRIRTALRATDTAARMGEDEFTILLEGVESAEEATAVADRIVRELREPFDLPGGMTAASASIGLAFSLPGATTLTGESRQVDLLRRADMALSTAKTLGKGRWSIHDPGAGMTTNQN